MVAVGTNYGGKLMSAPIIPNHGSMFYNWLLGIEKCCEISKVYVVD